MRILFITPVFYPADGFGGPVTAIHSLAKSLAMLGHEVTVYTTNAKDFHSNMDIEFEKDLEKNLKVFYFKNSARPMEWFISFSMVGHIIKNRRKFDVIHVHSYRQFQDMMMYYISILFGIDYAITSHGYVLPLGKGVIFKKLFDTFVGRMLLRRSRRIFALTQMQSNEYRTMGAAPEKIAIVPNGIDRFEYDVHGGLRSKLGISEDKFVVLYLGRLHYLKGVSFLIEGFSKLDRSDVQLVMAGPDYGYGDETKALIEKSDAGDRIHLIGTVSGAEKNSTILDADIVVYPTLYDVFPMVPLEAASAGKPVIITNVCEFAQILQDNRAGIVIQAKSSSEIAAAIEKMLDRKSITEMGKNAQSLIERSYLWETIAQKYLKEYERMLGWSA